MDFEDDDDEEGETVEPAPLSQRSRREAPSAVSKASLCIELDVRPALTPSVPYPCVVSVLCLPPHDTTKYYLG